MNIAADLGDGAEAIRRAELVPIGQLPPFLTERRVFLLLGAARAHAQQNNAKPSTLAAQDILEIQQLVANYSYALDTAADNGYMYADLFTADGAFGRSLAVVHAAAGKEPPVTVVGADQQQPAVLVGEEDAASDVGADHAVRHVLFEYVFHVKQEGRTGS